MRPEVRTSLGCWVEVSALLRRSVLQALDRGVTIYDQGLGDQDYKFHLPSRTVTCTTWGLFPREA